MTGTHRTTIQNLLVELGATFSAYQDKAMRNLKCKRLQWDAMWALVGCKQKCAMVEAKMKHGWGDFWTWTALNVHGGLACPIANSMAARAAIRIRTNLFIVILFFINGGVREGVRGRAKEWEGGRLGPVTDWIHFFNYFSHHATVIS
jgi:hypothetical protein